uniref:G_PROTEIN_RECEP_F1_2 domain-containing protein n=1 Tax=Trichuris muris TaxID=70415 RepID=A0A5S6QE68_TRIMR
MTESANTSSQCYYEKHQWLDEKFYLISVCGTFIAFLGIMANVATALVFKRPNMRSPSNVYLKALALCDCFLLITAVLLYSVEYFYEYFESVPLYKAWFSYVKYCYPLSNAAQTGSIYITMSVTLERYLAVVHPRRSCFTCNVGTTRPVIAGVVVFAVLFNFSKVFEINVVEYPQCKGFGSLALEATPLLSDEIYRFVYSLWLSQLVQVLIPFLTLLIFNTAIAISMRRHMVRQKRFCPAEARLSEMRERSRDATIILIVVVSMFLICNLWGLVMTLMEAFYGVQALMMSWPKFYAFSREAVNFLAIVHSSINFIIYYSFGKDFRAELESMVTKNRIYEMARIAFEHFALAKRLTCDSPRTEPCAAQGADSGSHTEDKTISYHSNSVHGSNNVIDNCNKLAERNRESLSMQTLSAAAAGRLPDESCHLISVAPTSAALDENQSNVVGNEIMENFQSYQRKGMAKLILQYEAMA